MRNEKRNVSDPFGRLGGFAKMYGGDGDGLIRGGVGTMLSGDYRSNQKVGAGDTAIRS